MSAPSRPAFYYDGIFGNDAGGNPAEESGWLVDDFLSVAKSFPDWMVEDLGIEVRLSVTDHRPLKRVVIAWETATAHGTIQASSDPSGYVLIIGSLGDKEVFRAYLDRPYEEYELWPPGADPGKEDEGPGRMGKHKNWVSLRVSAWPALAPLSNRLGGVNIIMDEAKPRSANG